MQKNYSETVDVINLIDSFKFLSEEIKNIIKTNILDEVLSLDEENRKLKVAAIIKVFSLFSNFTTEEIFYNGKIIFKGDNEYIYNSIAKNYEDQHELILFQGCIISKSDNNSYLNMNIKSCTSNNLLDINFDFKQLISEAIRPAAISIEINAEYYPELLKNL